MSSTPSSPQSKTFRLRSEKFIQEKNRILKQELLEKRLQIAKGGLEEYQKGKILSGIKKFYDYIGILALWKKVKPDELSPNLFEKTKEAQYELILLNGIYWNLCKAYDHSKNKRHEDQLNKLLKQYYIFSKDQPFQALSAETVRRYISSGQCSHVAEFRAVYLKLGGSRCFIASALVEHLEPSAIPRLRFFKTFILQKSLGGRVLIWIYYRVGPFAAQLFSFLPFSYQRKAGALLSRASRFLF